MSENESDTLCEITIDVSFEVLRKMDLDSHDPFTADERKAMKRLGMEIVLRGPELERVNKFLDENGLKGLVGN